MEEIGDIENFTDETLRTTTAFVDRTGTNAGMSADVTALIEEELVTFPTAIAGQEAQAGVVTTTATDQPVQPLTDLSDEDFDFVDAIIAAPDEVKADPEIAAAFTEVLLENGFTAEQAAAILSGDAQLPDLLATQTPADANNDTDSVAEADETVEGPAVSDTEEVDEAPVAAELDDSSGETPGVEAQTGTASHTDMAETTGTTDIADDAATGAIADDAATDTITDPATDDATATDMNAATDDAMDAADDTTDDCDDLSWTTPGANGLSALGQVVQMFEMMASQQGAMMPDLFAGAATPCEAMALDAASVMASLDNNDQNNADDIDLDDFG